MPLTGHLWPLATPHRERGLTLAIGLRPHWPHLRGGAATGAAPLTGHLPPDRLPTGEVGLWPKAIAPPASYWPKDRQLATFGHRLPHWPEKRTAPHRGATPLTGHPLATDWPQRGGHRREAFAPPLTGHPGGPHWPQRDGRGTPSPGPPPDWPPTHPLPTPADSGLRTGGLPTPTY